MRRLLGAASRCVLRRRCISYSVVDILPEIKTCLLENKPVVALESTIITHGMPYPANLETTLACQELIRREGCVPAVVAVLKGRVKVGLTEEELEYLAESSAGGATVKTSRRDFPFVLANGLNGGTTVSGTVIVADAVGIRVFATGGIGGVHRRGEHSMDVSADLQELARNPVMVVSSGIKSILDIGRTLEYLETCGVLVSTFGPSRSMPAFFSKNSAFQAPYNVESVEEASLLLQSVDKLGLRSGILLAVPIPDQYSFDYDLMEESIERAVAEAEQAGITGKQITPYLLAKINDLTQGKSLESNVALVKNNCSVAARIASSYSELKQKETRSEKYHFPKIVESTRKPVVIGGSVVDTTVSLKAEVAEVKLDGRTLPAAVDQCCGGVGRNLADAIGKLGHHLSFLSVIGGDQNGSLVLNSLSHIDCSAVEVLRDDKTATYTVLLNSDGDTILVAGNSDIHDKTDTCLVDRHLEKINDSNLIIVDSNIPEETMEHVLQYSSKLSVPVWIEPTSWSKCHKILSSKHLSPNSFVSPNLLELKRMASHCGIEMNDEFETENVNKLLDQVMYLSRRLLEIIPSTLMVTMDKFGVVIVDRSASGGRYYPALTSDCPVVNSSGAGDCAAAGFISGLIRGLAEPECMFLGHLASKSSLASKSPVPDKFLTDVFNVETAECIEIVP